VARTGQALNVNDAKQCPFHDGSRDMATGTVTKSVLSHPIKDQNDVTIAILQVVYVYVCCTCVVYVSVCACAL
jgi:hypothetical protein